MIKKRTPEEIDKILSTTSRSVILKNFVTSDEIKHLLNLYNNSNNKEIKKSGPTILALRFFIEDEKFNSLFNRIQKEVKENYTLWGGNYFQTDSPHIIHNDVPFDHSIIPGKCVLIPLEKSYESTWESAGVDEDAKFYIFDQMYFHGPVKCFKNNPEEIYSPYNIPLYEYDDIYGLHEDNRVPNISAKHVTKNQRQWLEGFSVECECNWVPGDVIIFDCARLHCSSSFDRRAVTQKIGLTLFTEFKNSD
jgi:hypothetical protein